MHLTDAKIAKIEIGARTETTIKDDKLTGFALRVRRSPKTGSLTHTFLVIWQERVDGVRKTNRAFIGNWKAPYSTADARREAEKIIQLRNSGETLLTEAQRKKAAKTIKSLAEQFETEHINNNLKHSTARDYRRAISKFIVPALGGMRIQEIDHVEIRRWHRSLASTPTQANRALATLSKMFSFGIDIGWCEFNPCSQVKRFPEHERDVWLNDRELSLFVAELNKQTTPVHDCLRFLATTGWRVSEATSLRWEMVDLRLQEVELPDTKSGAQRRCINSDACLVLDQVDHRTGFTFSHSDGLRKLAYKSVRLALRDVCKAAGVKVITPHCLRHTAATQAAIAGATNLQLRDSLGWKSTQMADRYVARAEALSRRGADIIGSAINLFERPEAEIIQLRKK